MVKQRREEAHIDERYELGRKNLETLAAARGWCKHLSVEMTSYGLLAEMSGLPIGSHDVSCQHAEHGLAGMNLPLILPNFVVENCRGCSARAPNGAAEWGDRVIAEHEGRVKQAHEQQAQLAAQLGEVRASRRTLAREAQGRTDFTVHGVLELTESLFAEDEGARNSAVSSLRQAARVAPELFHPAAVDLILTSASQPATAGLCLPVAAALAGRRDDINDRFVSVAVVAIDAGLPLEPACEMLVACGCGTSRPVPAGVIQKVVSLQNHIRPFGGWPTRNPEHPIVDIPPTYASSTAFLVMAFDQNSEAVLVPLRTGLQDNNKHHRVNVCGVAREVMNRRPAVGVALLPVIVDSLDLDDDMYGDSADQEACDLIGEIFILEPALADEHLRQRFDRQSSETQALTAGAYRRILRMEWKANMDRARLDEAVALAFKRCLALALDQRLDLEVRQKFADALESGCRHHPDFAMFDFDTMLGALACLCAQDKPPVPPQRIVLAGEPPIHPALRGLEDANRQTKWERFKFQFSKCLQELAGERPAPAAEHLLTCFDGLDSKTHEALKAKAVTLLGEVGRDREILPRVLPRLWVALMDYSSTLIRCRGIEAVTRCFERADCDPPPNVVEILVLHLKDSYVMVHQAAIRSIAWNRKWLTQEQAEVSIQQLARWASSYRKRDFFKLTEICRPILSLTRSVPEMRFSAVRFVAELMPTNEPHVDADLIELLTDRVSPSEDGAYCVVPQISAWLAAHQRDLSSDHADDGVREQVYDWLRSLPEETYAEERESLLESGRQVAAGGDVWGALRFAAVFAAFSDFQAEAEVLGLSRRSLPEGRRHDRAIQTLAELEQTALVNDHLARAVEKSHSHE